MTRCLFPSSTVQNLVSNLLTLKLPKWVSFQASTMQDFRIVFQEVNIVLDLSFQNFKLPQMSLVSNSNFQNAGLLSVFNPPQKGQVTVSEPQTLPVWKSLTSCLKGRWKEKVNSVKTSYKPNSSFLRQWTGAGSVHPAAALPLGFLLPTLPSALMAFIWHNSISSKLQTNLHGLAVSFLYPWPQSDIIWAKFTCSGMAGSNARGRMEDLLVSP